MKQPFILTTIFLGLISCGQSSSNERMLTHFDTAQKKQMTTTSDHTNPSVLFVQWQYPSTTTGMQALDVRQGVEEEIANALHTNGVGEWFAGDLGSGGANMLFEVSKKEEALEIIHSVINKEDIAKETVIAERIYTAPDDWTHKVIFPEDYKGVFNDL